MDEQAIRDMVMALRTFVSPCSCCLHCPRLRRVDVIVFDV